MQSGVFINGFKLIDIETEVKKIVNSNFGQKTFRQKCTSRFLAELADVNKFDKTFLKSILRHSEIETVKVLNMDHDLRTNQKVAQENDSSTTDEKNEIFSMFMRTRNFTGKGELGGDPEKQSTD